MKKTAIVCLLLVLSCSLFASGYVAPALGYSVYSGTLKDKDSGVKADEKMESTVFGLRGAQYFGSADSFGFSYGFGIGVPAKYEENGNDEKDGYYDFTVNGQLLLSYRLEISRMLSLHFGAGVGLWGSSEENTVPGRKTTRTYAEVDAIADAAIKASFSRNFGLIAGCQAYVPVYAALQTKVKYNDSPEIKTDYKLEIKGFGFMPYVGVAFCY